MDEGKLNIKITVAQRIIELTIRKEWEHYYKEAEKIINDSFFNFAKQWNYTDHQDIISKLLIDFVVKYIESNERLQEYEEDLIPKMQELNELADKIPID